LVSFNTCTLATKSAIGIDTKSTAIAAPSAPMNPFDLGQPASMSVSSTPSIPI